MRHLDNRLAFGIERLVFSPIVEAHPIDIVDKGFCGSALGKDQIMVRKFNMEIGEDLGNVGFTDNRGAIDQRAGLMRTPSTSSA